MKYIIIFYSLMLFFPAVCPSHAQYGDTESGGEESEPQEGNQSPGGGGEPVIIRQQPYEYYYWPEENLDSFGLSTLGQGQGGSTLGKSLQRKSNIDANAPEEPAGDEDAGMEEPGEEGTDTELYPPDEPAYEGGPPPSVPKESEFYEWVDDKGNVHITNNFGDVPPDQQEEIYNRRSAPGDE